MTAALAVLRKDAEEEKNWRSARSKLTEVLEAALTADAKVKSCTRLVQLEAQRTELQCEVDEVKRQLKTFAAGLAEKRQVEENTLNETRQAREGEERKLTDTCMKITELKNRLT